MINFINLFNAKYDEFETCEKRGKLYKTYLRFGRDFFLFFIPTGYRVYHKLRIYEIVCNFYLL